MGKHVDLDPLEPIPAHVFDSLTEFTSTIASPSFAVTIRAADQTVLEVLASAGVGQVALGFGGPWRYISATVSRGGVVGVARTMDVWATASANSFRAPVGAEVGEQDDTVYAFGLQITEAGAGAPGGFALTRKVASAVWDGAKFTVVDMLIGPGAGVLRHAASHATGAPDAVTPAAIGAASTGALATEASDRAAAVAAEAALRVAGDVNNPTAGQKAALAGSSGSPGAGNVYVTDADARFLAPPDGSVTLAKLAAAVQQALWQPGDLKASGVLVAQAGFLGCDGAAYSRVTYAVLFAATNVITTATRNATVTLTAIPSTAGWQVGWKVSGTGIPAGATIASIVSGSSITLSVAATSSGSAGALVVGPYGIGDGSTTFNVPDIQGRVVVGRGTHASVNSLSDNDGLPVINRAPQHYHVIDGSEMNIGGTGEFGAGDRPASADGPNRSGGFQFDWAVNHRDGPEGGPAWQVVNWYIKT